MTSTEAFERMERDGWQDPGIAKGYAEGFDLATRQAAEVLAETVTPDPGLPALDLCTGHGVVGAELLKRGAVVTALDFSPAMLELARRTAPGATFVEGDVMAMTFLDQSFDAVSIGFGVPHFPDPEKGLREVARVLKPGGRLAFSIWRGKGSNGAFGWLFEAIGRLGDPAVTLPDGPDAHMFADKEIAEPLLMACGFTNITMLELPSRVFVSSPEKLFDAFDKGAVRAASLLGGQPEDRRSAIRAELSRRVQDEGIPENGGLLVPVPSVVVSAMRA
ncbi:class I SAM-dependent methyltransferase [Roseibium alexandrii]|uniref:Methylase involved in ubiquinone/menaquinone biosynthesis n=1 Tax=Roseibium alexandrii (strain DSM 17067 / NCIMB 14079 / DFL-11) TaxID=244592 RepID=A0A5E8H5V3_ROSAD|nr:methyltransferase domain-containing protein [Roseibium alexandrii]EEE48049.2 Methylase involved in ubiquinone/menaquinone biosynthesis [Roseibium alexandrii DFL-11]